jgi:hypothetical protein
MAHLVNSCISRNGGLNSALDSNRAYLVAMRGKQPIFVLLVGSHVEPLTVGAKLEHSIELAVVHQLKPLVGRLTLNGRWFAKGSVG